MTNQGRRDLLQVLGELSEQCAEVRLGQLIANLGILAKGPTVEAIWDVEDEELLEAARQQLEVFRARLSDVA
ncbi:MAG: hypothetical protein HYZ50_00725 [Deltaproteobacteria bacterium]|nr:hypothetical protein [Deltaproteobacteria bacterium]